MNRLTLLDIAQIVKAHCAIEFGETVHLHRLVYQNGRWDCTAQAVHDHEAIGPKFGLLISVEGDVLEDALDVDDDQ